MANGRPNKESGFCDYQFEDGTYCKEEIAGNFLHESGQIVPITGWGSTGQQKYCLFHSHMNDKREFFYPEIKKRINDANDSVKKKIAELDSKRLSYKEKKKQEVRIRNEDPLDFEGFYFPINADFKDSNFEAAVIFNKTEFIKQSDFSGSKFGSGASFEFAKFGGMANFDDTKFEGMASFSDAKFSGVVSFNKSEFRKTADFSLVKFADVASFQAAKFFGEASFNEVKSIGAAYFDESEFNDLASFSDAEFNANISFYLAVFRNVANFGNAMFGGVTSFNKTELIDEANFRETKFGDNTSFHLAKIGKKAEFRKAKFTGEVSFNEAIFIKVSFWEANFDRKVSFTNSTFKDKANFSFARFDDEADFGLVKFAGDTIFSYSRFKGELILIYSQFSGKTDFNTTHFLNKVFFNNVNFYKDVDFSHTIFQDSLNFTDAAFFRGKLDFTRTRFSVEETLFHYTIFNCEVLFHEQMLKGVRFTGCYLGSASFYGSDVRDAVFINSSWNRRFLEKQIKRLKKDKRIEESISVFDAGKKPPRTKHRAVLFDEKSYKSSITNNITKQVKKSGSLNPELDPLYLEHLYCQFKLAMDRNKMYSLANDFYYGEKLMETKRLREEHSYLKWAFLCLYRLLAGFGNSPWRAIISLILILFASSFLLIRFNGLTALNTKEANERCPCERNEAKSAAVNKQNVTIPASPTKASKSYISTLLYNSPAPFNAFNQSTKSPQSAKPPVNIPQKKEAMYSLKDSYWCNTFYVSLWNLTASPGRRSGDFKENGMLASLAVFIIQYIFRPLMVALIIISVRRKVYRG